MAISFNGASGSVDLASGMTALQAVSGATVTCWYRPGAIAAAGATPIVSLSIFNGATPTGTSRYAIEPAVNSLITLLGRASDAETAKSVASASGTFLSGQLHHVAGVIRYISGAAGSCALYRDGALLASASAAFVQTQTANTPSTNGTFGANDTGTATFFTGTLDDVRIYSRDLSAGEIQTIFVGRGTDGIVQDLQHRYTFMEKQVGGIASSNVLIRDLGPSHRDLAVTGSGVVSYGASIIRDRRKVT